LEVIFQRLAFYLNKKSICFIYITTLRKNPIRQVKRILSYRMKMFDGENLFPQNDIDG